jgi:ubiquinone/menaquinone biosynthesis C-methylase UbiE
VSLYYDRIFPRMLGVVSRHFDSDRRRLLGQARGRVLELGVGMGRSLQFYPSAADEVVGIDPSRTMIEGAREHADRLRRSNGGLPFRVGLHQADAADLPYDDASFDTVVAFLTLCTIPDPESAVSEVRRVLRPDGLLLVLEHVRAATGPLAWWQDRLDPVWTRAAGGCHLNRDTAAMLRAAGFDTLPLERYRDQSWFPPASPRVRGAIRMNSGGRPR